MQGLVTADMNTVRKSSLGFTLIEILVASGLLATLVVFICAMILSAMRSQEFERSVRTATVATREAMNRMADELRLAAILPSAGTQSLDFAGSSNLPSGVLLPDSYSSSYSDQDSYGVYEDKVKGDRYVDNRLIFARPRMEAGIGSSSSYVFNPHDVSSYVYVEWLVPKDRPDRVWRRVYKINSGLIGKCGHKAEKKLVDGRMIGKVGSFYTGIWKLDMSYFLGNTYNSLTSKNSNLVSMSNTNRESDWLVTCLNANDDAVDQNGRKGGRDGAFVRNPATIKFTVAHPLYVNPRSATNSDKNIEVPYYTSYNRNLFYIKFHTVVFKDQKDLKTETNATKIDLETQVRLQTGA